MAAELIEVDRGGIRKMSFESFVWSAFWFVLSIAGLVALGRIWMYSKQQVELLDQILELLERQERSLPSAQAVAPTAEVIRKLP
jgi:heme exporter protein D